MEGKLARYYNQIHLGLLQHKSLLSNVVTAETSVRNSGEGDTS